MATRSSYQFVWIPKEEADEHVLENPNGNDKEVVSDLSLKLNENDKEVDSDLSVKLDENDKEVDSDLSSKLNENDKKVDSDLSLKSNGKGSCFNTNLTKQQSWIQSENNAGGLHSVFSQKRNEKTSNFPISLTKENFLIPSENSVEDDSIFQPKLSVRSPHFAANLHSNKVVLNPNIKCSPFKQGPREPSWISSWESGEYVSLFPLNDLLADYPQLLINKQKIISILHYLSLHCVSFRASKSIDYDENPPILYTKPFVSGIYEFLLCDSTANVTLIDCLYSHKLLNLTHWNASLFYLSQNYSKLCALLQKILRTKFLFDPPMVDNDVKTQLKISAMKRSFRNLQQIIKGLEASYTLIAKELKMSPDEGCYVAIAGSEVEENSFNRISNAYPVFRNENCSSRPPTLANCKKKADIRRHTTRVKEINPCQKTLVKFNTILTQLDFSYGLIKDEILQGLLRESGVNDHLTAEREPKITVLNRGGTSNTTLAKFSAQNWGGQSIFLCHGQGSASQISSSEEESYVSELDDSESSLDGSFKPKAPDSRASSSDDSSLLDCELLAQNRTKQTIIRKEQTWKNNSMELSIKYMGKGQCNRSLKLPNNNYQCPVFIQNVFHTVDESFCKEGISVTRAGEESVSFRCLRTVHSAKFNGR